MVYPARRQLLSQDRLRRRPGDSRQPHDSGQRSVRGSHATEEVEYSIRFFKVENLVMFFLFPNQFLTKHLIIKKYFLFIGSIIFLSRCFYLVKDAFVKCLQ